MDEEPKSKSWWQTLPGILTAVTGIITAVTGLVVALNQTRFFSGESKQAPSSGSMTTPSAERVPPTAVEKTTPKADTLASTNAAADFPATLSIESPETRMNELVYKILRAQIDRHSPGKLSLTFTIRLTNNDRFDTNFWDRSFRLLADGVLRAPENELNELVGRNSAKEGIVRFVIPENVSQVGLQMGEVGENAPLIPINLKATKSEKTE